MPSYLLILIPATLLFGFFLYGSLDKFRALRKTKEVVVEKPVRFIKLNVPMFKERTMFNCLMESFPAYQDEDMSKPKRLAFQEDVEALDKKLNLIIDHLNLTYQPETEKKEPAKLVEKPNFEHTYKDLLGMYPVCGGSTIEIKQPKKKRGRPKKK